MEWSNVAALAPAKLARLLEIETPAEWTEIDPAAILRQQLAAPLLPDLLAAPGTDSTRITALVRIRPAGETFLQHLLSPSPALELLCEIKAFAHHIRNDLSNPLHGEPASVIYFGAIAAALVRCGKRITALTDPQLIRGFEWMLAQPFAQDLAPLMRCAGSQLAPPNAGRR